MRAALVATALATFGAPQTGHAQEPSPANESPLVAYALEQPPDESSHADSSARNLRAALFELERNPPPANVDCAQTLGASRFAESYQHLASIRFERGEFEAAIEANEAALACTPRAADVYADIASLHVNLGRIAEARTALERGLAIDPEDQNLANTRARIDFLEERWADATAQFRLAIAVEPTGELADYYECFFWLAQRRAGVRTPETPLRDVRPAAWPAPILDMLKGRLTEAQLVEAIRKDATDARRQWLTEALYYVGELRLAEGDVETARRHFAAVVNLKITNYIEYGMARAELTRLRERVNRDQY